MYHFLVFISVWFLFEFSKAILIRDYLIIKKIKKSDSWKKSIVSFCWQELEKVSGPFFSKGLIDSCVLYR